MTIKYNPMPGSTIDVAARAAIKIAEASNEPVDLEFNGIEIEVLPFHDQQIIERYRDECDHRIRNNASRDKWRVFYENKRMADLERIACSRKNGSLDKVLDALLAEMDGKYLL